MWECRWTFTPMQAMTGGLRLLIKKSAWQKSRKIRVKMYRVTIPGGLTIGGEMDKSS